MRSLCIVLISVLGLASCSRDPNFVKKRYLDRGNVYFERGKYKEAAIMYKDALQKDQRYGAAHYKLALTYLKEGQMAGVVSELRKAVELLPKSDPDHWDAVVKLSEIYIAEASKDKIFMQEVRGYIHDLLARDPSSYDGHRLSGDYNFAQAFLAFSTANADEGRKLVAQAQEEYQKAYAIRPKQKELQMQMARVLWSQNKLPEAEQYYWDVIGEDKTYQIAYEELTKIQILQNQIPDAEKTLKLAYQNNPKQYRFLTQLAGFYSTLNQRDNMIGVLNQIKAHASDFPNAYLVVGDFYYRKHDLDKAEKEYREGMAADSKRKADYQKRIIELLLVEGKKTEAVEINNQILAADPKDDYAKGLQASMMLDSGEVNKALEQLQAVVAQAPQNPVVHYNLARAHLLRGEIEQARQQLQKAVEIRPDYVLARTKLAQIEIARGEWDNAMKSAGQILAVDRNSLVAHMIQAGALMGQKKFTDARALLQNMLKVYPNSPDVLIELGELDVQEKKYPGCNGHLPPLLPVKSGRHAQPGEHGPGLCAPGQRRRRGGHAAERIVQGSHPQRLQGAAGQRRGADRQIRRGHSGLSERAGFHGSEVQGARRSVYASGGGVSQEGRFAERVDLGPKGPRISAREHHGVDHSRGDSGYGGPLDGGQTGIRCHPAPPPRRWAGAQQRRLSDGRARRRPGSGAHLRLARQAVAAG